MSHVICGKITGVSFKCNIESRLKHWKREQLFYDLDPKNFDDASYSTVDIFYIIFK